MADWRKVDTRWIRQRDPENKSEWFFSERADLLVWRNRKSNEVVTFEFTWEPEVASDAFDRYYLRWEKGWISGTVDMGDRSFGQGQSPIVNENPAMLDDLRRRALDYIRAKALELREDMREFVMARLREPN